VTSQRDAYECPLWEKKLTLNRSPLVRHVPIAEMDRQSAVVDAGFDRDRRREQDAAVMIPLLSVVLPRAVRWQLTGQRRQ
jgi:hypothetical protein